MSYRILVTNQARIDLRLACSWWVRNHSPERADEWFDGFARAVYVVSENPDRFPLAGEDDILPPEIREFSYGPGKHATHRAVFTIRDDEILILRVRHLARKWFALQGV